MVRLFHKEVQKVRETFLSHNLEFYFSMGKGETDLKGLLILLAFFGIGNACSTWLHVPFPGNLLGMLMLTLCLSMGWIKLDLVEQASTFLIKHMMLFFVPIMVGVTQYVNVFQQYPWPILSVLLIGPPLVMLVTGAVVQRYVARQKQKGQKQNVAKGRAIDA